MAKVSNANVAAGQPNAKGLTEEAIARAKDEGLAHVLRELADLIENGDWEATAHFEHGTMRDSFGRQYPSGDTTILLHLKDPRPRWIAGMVRDRGADYVLDVMARGKHENVRYLDDSVADLVRKNGHPF